MATRTVGSLLGALSAAAFSAAADGGGVAPRAKGKHGRGSEAAVAAASSSPDAAAWLPVPAHFARRGALLRLAEALVQQLHSSVCRNDG